MDTGIKFAIAIWEKTIRTPDLIRVRRYVLRVDGEITTRLDTYKGNKRTLANLETKGWHLYPWKSKPPAGGVIKIMDKVDSQLLPMGYKRLI